LPKCSARYFTKTAVVFLRDAYHPFCCFWRASFLSGGGQRKEAKEDRLVIMAFILIVQ